MSFKKSNFVSIKRCNVCEKKEQEVGIVAPKVSSSVARVMGFHSTLDAKSNPLTRKHPPPHH